VHEDLLGDGEPGDRTVHSLNLHTWLPGFGARGHVSWMPERVVRKTIGELYKRCKEMALEVIGA